MASTSDTTGNIDNQTAKKRKSPPDDSIARRTRPKPDFSQGGDLTLESIDGRVFSVHSLILSVASPVFADMFEIGTRTPGEVVQLAETGEMIDLMLRFIYPTEPPTISSFDVLNRAMHVARKYELDGMQRYLRRELTVAGSAVAYSNDPLKAFGFAIDHELEEETQTSLNIARQTYQFNTVDDLVKTSKTAPASVPWILLFGIPGVKHRVIFDVLFKFHESPMKLKNSLSLCLSCSEERSAAPFRPPEWQIRWAHGLHKELMKRPMDTWGPLFEPACLSKVVARNGNTSIATFMGACNCVDRCKGNEREFMKW